MGMPEPTADPLRPQKDEMHDDDQARVAPGVTIPSTGSTAASNEVLPAFGENDALKACYCGRDTCLGQARLQPGFLCIYDLGIKALQHLLAASPGSAPASLQQLQASLAEQRAIDALDLLDVAASPGSAPAPQESQVIVEAKQFLQRHSGADEFNMAEIAYALDLIESLVERPAPQDDATERERRISQMTEQAAIAITKLEQAEAPAPQDAETIQQLQRKIVKQAEIMVDQHAEIGLQAQTITRLQAEKEVAGAQLRGMRDFLSGQPDEQPYGARVDGQFMAKYSSLNFAWTLGYQSAEESELYREMVRRADASANRSDVLEADLAARTAQLQQSQNILERLAERHAFNQLLGLCICPAHEEARKWLALQPPPSVVASSASQEAQK